ncbi:hypothetical protein BFR04_04110 [Gaetbulibacter sp. 4G1]|nr:hypothetical protein [Gaetbulibacter sp. 4G1]PIA78727.1 hypothetical protein BFR04_04110 [Gaetbulibacter sp. 4G1]
MKNQYFENQSLIEFLKLEFKSRENSRGFFNNISAFFQLIFFGMFNFQIKKEWNKQFKIIENKILNFHPDLKCTNISEKITTSTIFKMIISPNRVDRIHFDFNKAHLIVTSDILFFFPFKTPNAEFRGFHYNSLESSFRIVLKKDREKRKYHSNKNLEFISLKNKNENTVLTFKVKELKTENKIVFDKKITISNII